MKDYITIIGGGLAGTEAAYQIAKRGIKVKLYEMKPQKYSPAHSNENLAEIVCSNSFKSNLHTNACGLLKEELRKLDSLLIKIADKTAVPAGQALAVDREKFSEIVTEEIKKNPLIEVINKDKQSTDEQIDRVDNASRHFYGVYRNVVLSDSEICSLKEQFPQDYVMRIERLSEYMFTSGKNYKNHLATIFNWARRDAQSGNGYHHGMYTYDGNESL